MEMSAQAQKLESDRVNLEANYPKDSPNLKMGSLDKMIDRWHAQHKNVIDKINDLKGQMSQLQNAHPEIVSMANVQVAHINHLNRFADNYNAMGQAWSGGAERQQRMRQELEDYKKHANPAISELAKDVSNKLFGPKVQAAQTPNATAAKGPSEQQQGGAMLHGLHNHVSNQPPLQKKEGEKTPETPHNKHRI